MEPRPTRCRPRRDKARRGAARGARVTPNHVERIHRVLTSSKPGPRTSVHLRMCGKPRRDGTEERAVRETERFGARRENHPAIGGEKPLKVRTQERDRYETRPDGS